MISILGSIQIVNDHQIFGGSRWHSLDSCLPVHRRPVPAWILEESKDGISSLHRWIYGSVFRIVPPDDEEHIFPESIAQRTRTVNVLEFDTEWRMKNGGARIKGRDAQTQQRAILMECALTIDDRSYWSLSMPLHCPIPDHLGRGLLCRQRRIPWPVWSGRRREDSFFVSRTWLRSKSEKIRNAASPTL